MRVQPLRHLCKGGGHTDAEAVRPEYIQTDASSILQEIGKKSNRFCALAGDFLVEGRISCLPRRSKATVFSLPPSMREPSLWNDNSLASPVQGEVVCRRQSGGVVEKAQRRPYNPPASLCSAPSLTQGGLEIRQLLQARSARQLPRRGSQDQGQPGSLLAGTAGVCVFSRPRGRFFGWIRYDLLTVISLSSSIS